MNLQLIGINHKTSSVKEREAFIINDSTQIVLKDLFKARFKKRITSFFGISTCNRTELFILGDSNINEEVYEILSALFKSKINVNKFYFLKGDDAFIHMCKVASGIDSQVIGEQEVFGQFKNAFERAKQLKLLDKNMTNICNGVISIVKKVRNITDIGLNPMSIGGLTIKLINRIFNNPNEQSVLIIGAGEMGESLAKNLYLKGFKKIRVANRSLKKMKLDKNFNLITSSLFSIQNDIKTSDIVIGCSQSESPLIGKGAVENAIKKRGNRPILLVDLAVPRNIEQETNLLEQAFLFTIDDMDKIAQENQGKRIIEADKALNIIIKETHKFNKKLFIKASKDKNQKEISGLFNLLNNSDLVRILKSENIQNDLIKLANENNILLSEKDYKAIVSSESHVVRSILKGHINNA